MQAFLKKHGSGTGYHLVKVSWEIKDKEIIINFSAQKRSGRPWLSDDKFSSDWKENWGLWEKDVVEAFLQLRKTPEDLSAPYLEIQVSPLNQPFALVITEPRKKFAPPKALDFSHKVHVDGRSWATVVTLKLPDELQGEYLYGGFFSCLDDAPKEFYALEPNPEMNPDFHRPELFLPLDAHE